MNTRLGRKSLPTLAAIMLAGLQPCLAAELPDDIWTGRYGGFPSLTVGPGGAVSIQIPADVIAQAGGGSVSGIAKDFLDHWASDSCFQSFDFHSAHKNLKVQIAVLHPEGSIVVDDAARTIYTPSGYIDVVIDYEPRESVKCAPGS